MENISQHILMYSYNKSMCMHYIYRGKWTPWSYFSLFLFLKWFIRLHLNLYNLHSLIPIISSCKPPYLSSPNVHSRKLLKQVQLFYNYVYLLGYTFHTYTYSWTHTYSFSHTSFTYTQNSCLYPHPLLRAHLHFIHQYAFISFYVHLSYILFFAHNFRYTNPNWASEVLLERYTYLFNSFFECID